jgi:predicted nucleotidyltransferase
VAVAGTREVPREAQAAVDRFVAAVREAFGAKLLSVVLYGSAASGDFVPGRSDVNLALVLESIELDLLARCRPHLATWRRDGIALPLLLTPDDIRRSADIFPVEFLDIVEHHVLLHGTDFFADLSIDPRHLRFQVEHELKAKLVSLREAYLGGLDQERTDALVEDLLGLSVPALLALGRNLLRVAGHQPPARKADTPAALERALGVALPTLADLVARRARGQSLTGGEAVARFGQYLAEIDALARAVDRLGDPEALRGEGGRGRAT